MKTTDLSNLKIHKLTRQQYMKELNKETGSRIDETNEVYLVPPKHLMGIEGGEFTGGVSTSAYMGENINLTPQFRNTIIVDAMPTDETEKAELLEKLSVGDMIYIFDKD